MLDRLYVKNYAIIDETEVSFKNKLNILTGETGAGKSILIGSVNAALGAKTSKDVIRHGADYALIEISFSDISDRTVERLKEFDIYPDDGEIIISRKITSAGKSICKINGETVSLEDIRACSSLLLDIHGQNEHHSLLKSSSHLKVIDKYAGEEIEGYLCELKTLYDSYSETDKEYREAMSQNNTLNDDTSFLSFAVQEIEEADLREGEDEELEAEYKVLSNSKEIMEGLNEAVGKISGYSEATAEELTNEAIHALSHVTRYDESLSSMLSILEDASALLSDFSKEVSTYIDKAENSEQRYAEVSARLDLINNLKSKYTHFNGTIKDVNEYAREARAKLEKLEDFDGYISRLKDRREKLEKECLAICDHITRLRLAAAETFSELITKELYELNFTNARFSCSHEIKESFTAKGQDEMEFMIALNSGEPLKPLTKVASGGELSRVMLAIKSVMASKDDIPSLIFDEIDTGISGRTAQKVSEKLGLLSHSHQIICITHLPQIASMADTHFVIEKTDNTMSVKTEIKELSDEERVVELARMLGGVEITEAVLANAREMIKLAEAVKA